MIPYRSFHIWPKILWAALLLSCSLSGWAQRAGESAYSFLQLPFSARATALGGNPVGFADTDLNLAFQNPAALTDSLSGMLALNYSPYLADIQYGSVAFAHHVKHIGSFAAGVQYVHYGQFEHTDENENLLGTFRASDYAILLTYSRNFGPRWQAALTAKPLFSHMEQYRAAALALDAGVMYRSLNGQFSAGLALKNVGGTLKSYYEGAAHESVPTDIQAGISYKPRHAPFRFHATLYQLADWKESGEAQPELGDQLLRHTLLGMEFIPFKSFYVAMGYNHKRRQELKAESKAGTAGFSWGLGLKLNRFHFAYGAAKYHLAGSAHSFSVTTRLTAF